jgi:hypothetical protein
VKKEMKVQMDYAFIESKEAKKKASVVGGMEQIVRQETQVRRLDKVDRVLGDQHVNQGTFVV